MASNLPENDGRAAANGQDVQQLLAKLSEGSTADGVGEVARLLIQLEDADVDRELLAFFHKADIGFAPRAMASRILAERDASRDPSYALEWLAGRRSGGRLTAWSLLPSWTYQFPWTSMFGVSRLRRAEPLLHYSRQVHHWRPGIRWRGVVSLGDTADLAAIDILALGLNDRYWRVKAASANSIRRLRHFGASEVLSSHVSLDRLTACLRSSRKEVVLAAAYALCSMGFQDPVRDAGANTHSSALNQNLEAVLSGEIPPLAKMWEGDTNL